MAQLIGVSALCRLLAAGEKAGSKFAWIADEGLMLGAEFGAPDFSVDLGVETLVVMPRTRTNASAQISQDTPAAAPHRRNTHLDLAPSPAAQSAQSSMPALFSLPSFPGRQTGAYRLVLEGEIYAARSQKELLLIGLSAIELARPGTLAKLEREKSRTKRVVSRRRDALNDDPQLAEKFSQPIEDGWWVFTNNSFPETEKFLRKAGFHAGLHVDIQKLA